MAEPRDELAERARALEAERARPEGRHGRGEPTVEELLQQLIATLHSLYKKKPSDKETE